MVPDEYSYVKPFLLVGAGLVLLAHLPAVYYAQKAFLPEERQISPDMYPYLVAVAMIPLLYVSYLVFGKAKAHVAAKKQAEAQGNATRAKPHTASTKANRQ